MTHTHSTAGSALGTSRGLPAPMTTPRREAPPMATVRVFPFSIFDPVHLGIDEYGEHVHVNLAERNMLLGGEPGGGKSNALNLITAHGALSGDCKLVLIDGNRSSWARGGTAPITSSARP